MLNSRTLEVTKKCAILETQYYIYLQKYLMIHEMITVIYLCIFLQKRKGIESRENTLYYTSYWSFK